MGTLAYTYMAYTTTTRRPGIWPLGPVGRDTRRIGIEAFRRPISRRPGPLAPHHHQDWQPVILGCAGGGGGSPPHFSAHSRCHTLVSESRVWEENCFFQFYQLIMLLELSFFMPCLSFIHHRHSLSGRVPNYSRIYYYILSPFKCL